MGSPRRKPFFALAQEPEAEEVDNAVKCAEAKALLGLSRASYLALAPLMNCPGWKAMVRAARKLVPGLDVDQAAPEKLPVALHESNGLRGERRCPTLTCSLPHPCR